MVKLVHECLYMSLVVVLGMEVKYSYVVGAVQTVSENLLINSTINIFPNKVNVNEVNSWKANSDSLRPSEGDASHHFSSYPSLLYNYKIICQFPKCHVQSPNVKNNYGYFQIKINP